MITKQEKREENILDIITNAIESIAIYKGMVSLIDSHKDNSVFITLLNNCAMIAVIRICNIFGTDSENNHWKKLFEDHNSFRNTIILPVFDNFEEYEKYNHMLKNFRNDFVVHFIEDSNVVMPYFEPTLKLLTATLKYILDKFKYNVDKEPIKNAEYFYEKIYYKTVNMFKAKD